MRLIDADALKQKIEQAGGEGTIANYCRKVMAQCLDHDAPTVEAIPIEWISVKDKMPEDLGTVLIAHKGGVSLGWFDGLYWTRGAATKHKPIKTVTHWMPLPEPPKEEERV